MNSRTCLSTLALFAVTACQSARPTLEPELCVREDGTATPTWTAGIAVAIGPEAARRFELERTPLTPGAKAWFEVLQAALPSAEARAAELATLFDIEPFNATVAAGNRGSSDAFAWLPRHIGINLEAFVQTYGVPDSEGIERMTRIVSHEYIHLLTYAFYPHHRELRDTPLNRALWTMFFEGIGDYVSISARWLPDEQGRESDVAARTLARLEPILVQRLEALVDASVDEEPELRRQLSSGKFNEKWGSLPVALWLHREARTHGEREALETLIRLGPEGVLPLARMYAAPDLQARLEALAACGESASPAARCPPLRLGPREPR